MEQAACSKERPAPIIPEVRRIFDKPRRVSPLVPAIIISAAYLLFGLLSLDRFGITWDEPAPDHFYVGDLYLDTLLRGEWGSLTAEKIGRSMENYGPVFDIVGAFNARLLHGKFHLLAEDNARHLHLVVAASLTVFFVCLLASQAYSLTAGVFAALFLAAFPRFIADSFNNPKDTPIAFVFTLCFFLFYRRIQTGKKWYSLGLALAGGLGFATRATYIFAPIVILLYTIVYLLISGDWKGPFAGRLISLWDLWLALVFSVPFGMCLWPYFWTQPLTKLKDLAGFYYYHATQAKLGVLYRGKTYIPGLTMPWHYAPVMLWITTPLITLGSCILGIVSVLFPGDKDKGPPVVMPQLRGGVGPLCERAFREGRRRFGAFLVCWLVLGIIPFILPGQRVYDGIRHFLFVVPALCLLAGIGMEGLFRWSVSHLGKAGSLAYVFILYALLFADVFAYHPDYTVYYNALVGGPKGAFRRYSLDYWGNSYKRGCAWLNANLPPRGSVLVAVAPQIARFYLRPDLIVFGPEELASHPALRYDYSMYVIRDNEPLVAKTKTPVFQVAVKGQAILKIHKWRQ